MAEFIDLREFAVEYEIAGMEYLAIPLNAKQV